MEDSSENTEETKEEKRKPGRPSKPKDDTVNSGESKSLKQCKYQIWKPENLIIKDMEGIPRERLEDKFISCENVANGLNGFCRDHTYLVRESLQKEVEETIVEQVLNSSGAVVSKSRTENNVKMFNAGENLPGSLFSDTEMQTLVDTGKVVVRLDQDTLERHMDEKECEFFMKRTNMEIKRRLEVTIFTIPTLNRMLYGSNNDDIRDYISDMIDERAKNISSK